MNKSTIMRNLFTILFWLLLSVAPVFAADLLKGLEALQSGDFANALQELRPLAEQGNADAQFALGVMYANGKGVAEDDTQAVYWYRKAAEQGDAPGQWSLAAMYKNGHGVVEDDTQAVYWYRKAAEQGDAYAQYNLGIMYDQGNGVAEDDTQAVYWYRKAAEQGYASAQFNLGVTYDFGYGVAEDDKQAVYWYRKAAEQGEARAQFNLGFMFDLGKGVAEDDTQAVYWYKKAAEQGHAQAQYYLGNIYAFGNGIAEDNTKAVYWYRKAAEQENASAQYYLGFMFDLGKGVAEDDTQAVYWYKKAAEQGDATGQWSLATMYKYGEGVAEDYILAYKWANLAGAQGYKNAIELKNSLRQLMTPAQIAEAQRLSREWSPMQSTGEQGKAAATTKRKQNPPDYTGSSFVVSLNGHVLTNRHVVRGCGTLRVGGQKTRVISEDANNDLALLRLEQSVNSVVSFREGRGARIGEKVVVAGFPLRGLLSSGLNVTFGNISALVGIGNDSRLYQISAPVNLGNSGGPLLDSAGHIVGIVTSKLNALRTAELTGDIPQGVNFAIKSSVIRLFLDLNTVDYKTARSVSQKSTTQISAEAQKYTLLVQCWK